MGYKLHIEDELFVVVWETPSPGDVKAVMQKMRSHRETVGKPLAFAGVIPPHCKPPSDEARQAIAEAMESLDSFCDEVFVVYEGTGFAAAAIRSVFGILTMRSRSERKPIVCSSLDGAAQKTSSTHRRKLLARASMSMSTVAAP